MPLTLELKSPAVPGSKHAKYVPDGQVAEMAWVVEVITNWFVQELGLTASGLVGLREARAALQGGMITGAGADQILGLQKIGSALGLANSDKIVNTETFRAAIAPQVAAMIKASVGTTNISNTDREFAEKATGGNITLDERSIARLLDIMERAGSAQLAGHMKRLEKVYPDAEKFARERALFGVDVPAAVPSPAGKPSPTETRTINGKTYFKQDGQWFEGQ